MAPFTPYITEELYDLYFKEYEKKKSIHLESWPQKIKISEEEGDELSWNRFIEAITLVRQKKSEAKKSVKAEIVLTIPENILSMHEDVLQDLKSVTNSKEVREGSFDVKFL